MVGRRPKRLASGTARRREIAVRTCATAKATPSVDASTAKRVCRKYATSDWRTKPPPNESSANNAASRRISGADTSGPSVADRARPVTASDSDVAQHRRQHHHPGVARDEQEERSHRREAGESDQRDARTVPLGRAPHGPRERRAADEHQGDGGADARRAQAQVAQVEGEDDP